MPTIKVRSRAQRQVSDFKQLFNGVKKFVGWRHDATLGEDVEIIDENGQRRRVRQGGFVQLEEDVELDVSDREIALEYRKALAQGDLWPADQTACDFANDGGFAKAVAGQDVVLDLSFGKEPKKPKKEG